MLWDEIEKHYSKPKRHYHTLAHLNSILEELQAYKANFSSWDTVVFAIAYHDIIYNVLKSDNEERSAQLATERLTTISFPPDEIQMCSKMIVATKKHEPHDFQTNLFTDADLSILGAEAEVYAAYSKQIRREYSLYPDFAYNPGRRKVLQHFLEMENIYKTKEFSDRYETKARINLQAELNSLM